MANPNPNIEGLSLGRGKRPKEYNERVTMRLPSETIKVLEKIAENYGSIYGGKPWIAGLLKMIGSGELIVVPDPSTFDAKTAAKNRLKKDYIVVFTPQKNAIKLPKDSTPIDFAFKIHSDIGNKCTKAFVNGKEEPLDTPLMNGDTIEIITGAKYQLKEDNLINAVKTPLAQKSLKRNRDRYLTTIGWKTIKDKFGKKVKLYSKKLIYAKDKLNLASLDKLALSIGSEKITIDKLEEFFKDYDNKQKYTSKIDYLLPKDRKDILSEIPNDKVKISLCCKPTPKDKIKGILRISENSIESIVVHSSCCPNLDMKKIDPQKIIDLDWNCDRVRIELQITLSDNPDSLRTIWNSLAEQLVCTNLHSVNPCKKGTSLISFEIDINSSHNINDIIKSVKNNPQVLSINIKRIIPLKGLNNLEDTDSTIRFLEQN